MSQQLVNDIMHDTIMFLTGIIIGGILDLHFANLVVNIDSRKYYIMMGFIQILVNALILQSVKQIVNGNTGLFFLGLMSVQKLYIRKLFNYKSKVLQKKEQQKEQENSK